VNTPSNSSNKDISSSKAAKLRAMLLSDQMEFIMEAHNGLSARICEETGFNGVWASGLSISAALCVRDNNEASWTQVLEVLEFMSDATEIPILVDGDTGYGNFNNMRRLVRKLEQRDIAGVCIEDKLFPKTNSFFGSNQPLADIDEFCGKLKAAKDSQSDDDFSVIARIEALISGWGLDEALKRAEAYHNAGADAVLIHSKIFEPDEILNFCKEWANRCPVVIVPTMYYATPTQAFRDAGVSLTIWANHNMRAAMKAMREVSQQIFEDQNLIGVEDKLPTVKDVFDLAGNAELAEAEKRYLPSNDRKISSIILAASRGSALAELTEDKPKAMLDVRGQPLLRRLVQTLNESGLNDITVVRGYKKDVIDLPSIRYVDNDDFAETRSAASLACAADRITGECIVSYGDILFRPNVLNDLTERTEDVVLAVDAHRQESKIEKAELVRCSKAYDGDYFDDETTTLVEFTDDSSPNIHGEFIGLLKLSEVGAKAMQAALSAMTSDGSIKKALLSQVLDRMKTDGVEIAIHYISGPWLDVDNAFDLARARNIL
jgi:phosphoenolpyruvate phosphomutase